MNITVEQLKRIKESEKLDIFENALTKKETIKVTKSIESEIIRMRGRMMSVTSIAEKLDISVPTVFGVCKKNGLNFVLQRGGARRKKGV